MPLSSETDLPLSRGENWRPGWAPSVPAVRKLSWTPGRTACALLPQFNGAGVPQLHWHNEQLGNLLQMPVPWCNPIDQLCRCRRVWKRISEKHRASGACGPHSENCSFQMQRKKKQDFIRNPQAWAPNYQGWGAERKVHCQSVMKEPMTPNLKPWEGGRWSLEIRTTPSKQCTHMDLIANALTLLVSSHSYSRCSSLALCVLTLCSHHHCLSPELFFHLSKLKLVPIK